MVPDPFSFIVYSRRDVPYKQSLQSDFDIRHPLRVCHMRHQSALGSTLREMNVACAYCNTDMNTSTPRVGISNIYMDTVLFQAAQTMTIQTKMPRHRGFLPLSFLFVPSKLPDPRLWSQRLLLSYQQSAPMCSFSLSRLTLGIRSQTLGKCFQL